MLDFLMVIITLIVLFILVFAYVNKKVNYWLKSNTRRLDYFALMRFSDGVVDKKHTDPESTTYLDFYPFVFEVMFTYEYMVSDGTYIEMVGLIKESSTADYSVLSGRIGTFCLARKLITQYVCDKEILQINNIQILDTKRIHLCPTVVPKEPFLLRDFEEMSSVLQNEYI